MSKAFTKEPNGADDEEQREDLINGLPPGAKNYMTPAGAKKLQDELRHLKTVERPKVTDVVAWAASLGDRSENADYIYGKKRLREIDRRIRFLAKRLEIAEVVDPISIKSDKVLFGATVTIRDEDDRTKQYSIVGVDEVDVEKGRISWVSPLASALFKAAVGDIVTFKSPKGEREVEVVIIQYIDIAD